MSYDQYDPGGLTVEELNNRLMALQSRLASTISDVKREDGKLTEKQSQILQDIDSITLSVSELQTTSDATVSNVSALSVRADGIDLSVAALDTRLGAAETSISLNAGEIALKASVDYVDSELVPIVSDIDGVKTRLSSAEASITVQATEIQSKVSQTTYTTDLTSMNNRISSAESSITQNASQIALRVLQTDYNGASIVSLIEQTAASIKLSAAKIELDGITHINGNVELGKGWEPGGVNGAKSITFSNAGKISYNDGFVYAASTFGHLFKGSVTIQPNVGYFLDVTGVEVRGLNVVVSFG